MKLRFGKPSFALSFWLIAQAIPHVSSLLPDVATLCRPRCFPSNLQLFRSNDNNKKILVHSNDVVGIVDGIKQKQLGGDGGIVVSELGLGTQRWVSDDYNAPDEQRCHDFLDEAVLNSGVNLIDTAEQYPIPSSRSRPEGLVETVIGNWIKKGIGRRSKLVISTKITGSSNVNRKNIFKDCEGSLSRLKTDYIDLYLLHWPARYSPQSNWGQSLMYHHDAEKFYNGHASFEEIVTSMAELIKQGKIRGYGFCNDNAFGLTSCAMIAKHMNLPAPVVMQNDFSLINRRIEENGLAEASSPIHLNTGFMAYNALAGGVLTGKYFSGSCDFILSFYRFIVFCLFHFVYR